jgi:isopropylmalate/citramalate/homocitrate synthase-like protein
MAEKIEIFDTTLRDGEQTPGVSLNLEDKVNIAKALDRVGVNIIEAGFAVVSEGDFNAVKAVAELDIKAESCSLARCNKKDIDAAIDAGVDWAHIFIGTSPLHRKYKLDMSKDEILQAAQDSIKYCVDKGTKVHFSPEDACRTEYDYLEKVCVAAQEAGAEIINIPDTVGVMTPAAMSDLITKLKEAITVPIAVHCHNDFGLAVANTLSAIRAGATIPHTTINGLGERAGNADMEQVVMALEYLENMETDIKLDKIYTTSKLVERLSGVRLMPNFPIVGDNAFAHESGIHVHGILKKASTYEAFPPETVGARRRLVLGKHVGAHGVAAKLKELGIEASEEQAREITKKVKDLGDKNKKVTEEDLMALAQDVVGKLPEKERLVELKSLEILDKLDEKPRAKVRLRVGDKIKEAEADGVGPVDASLNAIKSAVSEYGEIDLEEFHLDAITGGSDALADVTVKISDKKHHSLLSRGVHENVNMAAIYAFINGLNKLLGAKSTK